MANDRLVMFSDDTGGVYTGQPGSDIHSSDAKISQPDWGRRLMKCCPLNDLLVNLYEQISGRCRHSHVFQRTDRARIRF
jgi:hypothetical protein